ncbi:hypothetical protein IT881_11155 [Erythrobacter sp. A30-3]|jgi:hypothetical protein|nr:hypothetical protein IT881_11155 [Erythrobacter sp. A30-3]
MSEKKVVNNSHLLTETGISAHYPIADKCGKPNGDILILCPTPHFTSSLRGYPNFLLQKSIKR